MLTLLQNMERWYGLREGMSKHKKSGLKAQIAPNPGRCLGAYAPSGRTSCNI